MGFVIRATGGRVILIHVAKQNGYESCLLFSPEERSAKNVSKENVRGMQDDTISRQAAIDALSTITMYKGGIPFDTAVMRIKQLPPIQPRRGKWIEDKGQQTLMQNFIERGEVWRVCSVCGAGHMIGHKYASDKAYHDRHHNFCPNCGAKMGGEQDG